jgi:hypothetical protein
VVRDWRADDLDEEAERPPSRIPAALLTVVGIAWGIALYDGLPAVLAWAVSAGEGLDVFSQFIEASLQQRLGRLGLFLSVVAAIITTESVTRLVRPFGLAEFLLTALGIGGALFPFLAASHRVSLGLTADQLAVLLSYAYLALKIFVGILIGATVSWVLLAHGPRRPAPAPYYVPRA